MDWFTKPWGACAQQKDAAGRIISEVATLSCIPVIFANLLSVLLTFSGLTALIMFIAGSFKTMNAAGDPKKIESANNNYKFAIIGLTIVAASFMLISLISIVTGVKCIADFANFGFGCK